MSTIKMNTLGATIALATAALFAGTAQAATSYTNSIFGETASASSAVKHVDLSQGKRAVNVTDGDTVEFTKDGQSFTWHFDTLAASPSLNISAIAPRGFAAKGVKIYVDPNPANNGA